MEPVTLDTERLRLRPMEPGDVDAVHAACQDPEIPRWTSLPSPYTRQDAETFVLKVDPEGWRENRQYNFAVTLRDSGTLVGSMGIVEITPIRIERRIAEIGFWTARPHRGRGYTTEGALAVARWAFTDLGVDRLEWYAEVGNEASRAVALRVGFTMEGTLRAKIIHRNTRRDAWVGSLLPSDLNLPSTLPYLPPPA